MRITFFTGVLLLTPQLVQAQVVSDAASLYSGIAFSVASFIVLILAIMLIRRLANRRKNDLAESSGLDLMGMRQKNLLTPDEMKLVSAAIARKMADKDARKTKANAGLSTSTLLHDPEVLRLQELAREKREQEQRAAGAGEQTGGQGLGQGSRELSAQGSTQEPAGIATDIPVAASQVDAPFHDPLDPIPPDFRSPSEIGEVNDVVLPPEVQQLADAGLLSEEEIENVKRRLKARQ